MSRSLDDLSDKIKPLAFELLARCSECGIPVVVVYTGRTQEEQDDLYDQGRKRPGKIVTWTRDSAHVMKPPEMKSHAIDICPLEQYNLHGPDKLAWNTADPVWQRIGAIGESLGLQWGIMVNGEHLDVGHFQLKQV